MPKYKTTSIDWDTDGQSVDLPQEVTIEADNEDDLVDVITDKYGYCIFGLVFVVVS